jgi:hypothetical protein
MPVPIGLVNTSAFIVTDVLKLPISRLLASLVESLNRGITSGLPVSRNLIANVSVCPHVRNPRVALS